MGLIRGLVAGLLVGLVGLGGCARPAPPLPLATTTTLENSGLLAVLLPEFEKASGIAVNAIIGGSGRALDLLDRGDADAALTHDPEAERRRVDAGRAALYRKVMFNDFVIAGPATDPAGVRSAASAADAMRRIAAADAPFASRADSSGTHTREQSLWRAAGTAPTGSRLIEVGQGMATTLRVASERGAYALTDRATFRQIAATLRLEILHEGGPTLLNAYAVMYRPDLDADRLARVTALVQWLTDGPGREVITQFRIQGQPAFTVWPAGAPRDHPDDLPHAR